MDIEVFGMFEEKLKANPKTIVFTEGTDPRILSAASRLLAGGILKVILLDRPAEVERAATGGGFDVRGAEVIDPKHYAGMDEMVAKMVEMRKGKMSEEQCRDALQHANYFGTMLVKLGKADCLLGGATYSTADTVRPALQLIKCKAGIKSVSSCFI
ncbi:MAG: phosphate acyltransferase, partial [Gemmiger sp.]|nr:phosphate acyltransferase [Gemmiger sp.]